jgi:hypothetical protein
LLVTLAACGSSNHTPETSQSESAAERAPQDDTETFQKVVDFAKQTMTSAEIPGGQLAVVPIFTPGEDGRPAKYFVTRAGVAVRRD